MYHLSTAQVYVHYILKLGLQDRVSCLIVCKIIKTTVKLLLKDTPKIRTPLY